MSTLLLLVGVALFLLVAVVVMIAVTKSNPLVDGVPVVIGVQKGDADATVSPDIPLSFNQREGIVFSYAGWILIKDFTVGYGERRRILSKGDSPGLYIDSTSNSLVVALKTYGTTETILIPDIPARKWIHFAIVVDQDSADIYINGMIRQHHTLTNLPDQQTTEPIRMGPGWDGVLAHTTYFPRALSETEVRILSQDIPKEESGTPGPSYFDITWYTGRFGV